jgi:hypothetical protein
MPGTAVGVTTILCQNSAGGRIGTLRMQEWQLNSAVEIFIDASAERLWAALTEAADTEQYFMCSRVTVGDVGEAYRLEREDGWEVDGTVLAKEPRIDCGLLGG